MLWSGYDVVKHTLTTLAEVGLLLTACCTVSSQDEVDNEPRASVNLGMPLSGPVTPMGQSPNFGWGVTVGGGHTFTWTQAIVGGFKWRHLFVPGSTLAPIRAALQNSDSNGSGELYALTGHYRFELRGKTLGMYLAAGGDCTTLLLHSHSGLQRAQASPGRQHASGGVFPAHLER